MNHKIISPGSIVILSTFEGSIISFKGPLIEDFVKKNYKVYILAPNFSKETLESIKKIGAYSHEVELSRTGFNIFRDLMSLVKLVLIMRKLKPVIFLGYYIKPVIWGGIAAFIARVPKRIVMVEGLGHIFTQKRSDESFRSIVLRQIVSFLYWLSFKVSHVIFFLNIDDKFEFENRKIVKKNKSFVLGGIGLKLPEWPFLEPVTERINFLFIGRLVGEKGIGEFISAARIIKQKYPNTSFTALGNLEEREVEFSVHFLKEVEEEGIMLFPGHVPVIKWLKLCSVFVLPSYREGVPRSTQEAMASGKPVITSDAPGCKDTVEEGRNGFLVPVKDINALVKAMEKFILNPNIISSMGIEARKIAEEKFDVNKVNKIIFKISDIK